MMKIRTKKDFIPWTDIIVYGGLGLFLLFSFLWAIITVQEWLWYEIMIAIIVAIAFVGISTIVIYRKLKTMPDYVTRQGVAVWLDNKHGPPKEKMEKAITHFMIRVPIGKGFDKLINKLCVIWSLSPVSAIMPGVYKVLNKAGIQEGYRLKVWWKDSIKNSALFHEIGHAVRQYVLKRDIDYKHEDSFWEVIKSIENEWEEIS